MVFSFALGFDNISTFGKVAAFKISISELGAAAAINADRQALYRASVCTAPTTIFSASQEPIFAELREMRRDFDVSYGFRQKLGRGVQIHAQELQR